MPQIYISRTILLCRRWSHSANLGRSCIRFDAFQRLICRRRCQGGSCPRTKTKMMSETRADFPNCAYRVPMAIAFSLKRQKLRPCFLLPKRHQSSLPRTRQSSCRSPDPSQCPRRWLQLTILPCQMPERAALSPLHQSLGQCQSRCISKARCGCHRTWRSGWFLLM